MNVLFDSLTANIPDHSLISCVIKLSENEDDSGEDNKETHHKVYDRNNIPQGFAHGEVSILIHNTIQTLEAREANQEQIDKTYNQFSSAILG